MHIGRVCRMLFTITLILHIVQRKITRIDCIRSCVCMITDTYRHMWWINIDIFQLTIVTHSIYYTIIVNENKNRKGVKKHTITSKIQHKMRLFKHDVNKILVKKEWKIKEKIRNNNRNEWIGANRVKTLPFIDYNFYCSVIFHLFWCGSIVYTHGIR